MMPHPALAGLQPPSAAAALSAAGMPPSSSAAAGLLALSAAGSLASAASAASSNNNSSHSLSGIASTLSKESSHRENSEKRALNGKTVRLNTNHMLTKHIF